MSELTWRQCPYYRNKELKDIECGDIIVSSDYAKPICITNYGFHFVKGVLLDGHGEVVEGDAPFGDCVIVYRPIQKIADLSEQLSSLTQELEALNKNYETVWRCNEVQKNELDARDKELEEAKAVAEKRATVLNLLVSNNFISNRWENSRAKYVASEKFANKNMTAGVKQSREGVCMPEEFEDYITHHGDFRRACEIAMENADDEVDKSYWQHQINTLDKLKALTNNADKE